jgi:LAS superfamily LD-carboxypeptidase LdcB
MRACSIIIIMLLCALQHATGQSNIKDSVDIAFLLGKTNYANDKRFTKLPMGMSSKENAYLLNEVTDSLMKMIAAAKKDGIQFQVISASRSFDQQKNIWEKKWLDRKQQFPDEKMRAQNILRYSSMPGTSRHHWGTDFDLNSLNPQYFNQGRGKLEYEWLIKNAKQYGFYQPYSDDEKRTGYQEEKWHWSFFPLSSIYLSTYIATIKPEDINGFKGAQQAKTLQVIPNYVAGIAAVPMP